MDLQEFLSTANVDDAIALTEARAYESTRLWRIEGAVRKTQVETAVIVNDTIASLQSFIDVGTQPQAGLAKAIKRALDQLYNAEFYINLNDPTVKSMFDNAKALGVLTTAESDAIEAAATYVEQPFANTTLEQVKAARYPVSWQPVTIGSGNDKVVLAEGDTLISASNRGGFRFTLTPAEDFKGVVKIRVKAKKSDDTVFGLFNQFPITFNDTFEANQAIIQMFKRVAGLSGFRHFIFEYDAPYAGAITDVVVDAVAE